MRAHLAAPEALTAERVRRIRHLLALARLDEFEPQAASGARSGRVLSVGEESTAFRQRVGDLLGSTLRAECDPALKLRAADAASERLVRDAVAHRRALLECHDVGSDDLEAEIGHRRLTLVLGGGGAAAYSYLGAFAALVEADRLPDYVVGSSVGAVMGALLARQVPVPIDDYLAFAAGLTYRGVVGPATRPRRHGVRAPLALRLEDAMDAFLRNPDGTALRLSDTAIPFDVVAAGLRGHAARVIPATVLRAMPALARRRRPVPERMPGAARPVLLGADELSRQLSVADAISISSAIPGMLHHETADPDAAVILDSLMVRHRVDALVDGSTVSNVPAEQAWSAVRAGRIGGRDTAVVALDCFYPQARPRQAWYAPVAGLVGAQWNRNRLYCDAVVRMPTTIAPSSLAPGRACVERAAEAGAANLRTVLPFIDALTAPTSWADVER